MTAKVYIIILNWNGWQDTIECLESVFRLSYPNYSVVVCDNDSSDDSCQQLSRWALSELAAQCNNEDLFELINPPVPKPIEIIDGSKSVSRVERLRPREHLIMIRTGGNLGFAGGNNAGIRYALSRGDCDFVWLLNNDTVVDVDALTYLVEAMRVNARLGMCGSLTLSYRSPHVVQAFGGRRYSRWAGRVLPSRTGPSLGDKSPRMVYVNGASMLVSKAFLESVGLLDEVYFLYFEELDWAARAKGKFEVGYAQHSIVYHKEGASTGTSEQRKSRSLISERFLARNRVLFTRKHYPNLLPSVLFWVIVSAIRRAVRGEFRRARLIVRSALEGLVS